MANDTADLLKSSRLGDKKAQEDLFVHLYDHLRRLGEHYVRQEASGSTLQATALVHEAYVKLLGGEEREWESRAHFLAVASLAMRHVLRNHVRDQKAQKRGGGWQRVTLGIASHEEELDVLLLSDALERLADLNPRHADVVTARLIGGLTVEETARALDLSERTVKSDWQMARAWLSRELGDRE